MIQTKIETISPKTATQYLLTNKHNRKLRDAHVEYLRNEILAGRWLPTHQGIAFDESGELIDGQHRLRAVIASNTPIKILVSRGVPKHVNGDVNLFTMDVIDNGAVRTTGDQLALMHGIKNSNLTAATCRALANIFDTKAKLSVGAANRILAHYGEAVAKVIDALSSRHGPARRAPIVAACALG